MELIKNSSLILAFIHTIVLSTIIDEKDRYTRNNASKESVVTAEDKKQEPIVKVFERTKLLSAIIYLIVGVAIIIYVVFQEGTESKAFLVFSSFGLLGNILVYIKEYNITESVKRIFISDKDSKVGIADLSFAGATIGYFYTMFAIRANYMQDSLSLNTYKEQGIYVATTVMTIAVLSVLLLITMVEIAFFVKKKGFIRLIKKSHKKCKNTIVRNSPLMKYARKHNGKISNKKIQYHIIIVLEVLYGTVVNFVFVVDYFVSILCEMIEQLVKNFGALVGIRLESRDSIGDAGSLRSLFGWCFVLAITITFAIITFMEEIDSKLLDLYSFIAGIIVIPTVIDAVIKHRHG